MDTGSNWDNQQTHQQTHQQIHQQIQLHPQSHSHQEQAQAQIQTHTHTHTHTNTHADLPLESAPPPQSWPLENHHIQSVASFSSSQHRQLLPVPNDDTVTTLLNALAQVNATPQPHQTQHVQPQSTPWQHLFLPSTSQQNSNYVSSANEYGQSFAGSSSMPTHFPSSTPTGIYSDATNDHSTLQADPGKHGKRKYTRRAIRPRDRPKDAKESGSSTKPYALMIPAPPSRRDQIEAFATRQKNMQYKISHMTSEPLPPDQLQALVEAELKEDEETLGQISASLHKELLKLELEEGVLLNMLRLLAPHSNIPLTPSDFERVLKQTQTRTPTVAAECDTLMPSSTAEEWNMANDGWYQDQSSEFDVPVSSIPVSTSTTDQPMAWNRLRTDGEPSITHSMNLKTEDSMEEEGMQERQENGTEQKRRIQVPVQSYAPLNLLASLPANGGDRPLSSFEPTIDSFRSHDISDEDKTSMENLRELIIARGKETARDHTESRENDNVESDDDDDDLYGLDDEDGDMLIEYDEDDDDDELLQRLHDELHEHAQSTIQSTEDVTAVEGASSDSDDYSDMEEINMEEDGGEGYEIDEEEEEEYDELEEDEEEYDELEEDEEKVLAAKDIQDKMKDIYKEEILAIPAGVEVQVKARQVTIKGPRGTLSKNFRHVEMDIVKLDTARLRLVVWHGKRKHVACLRTIRSLVNNMIIGVTKGYEYKMRFVYAHFPINVIIADDEKSVEIRNFLGQKIVMKVPMLEGVTIYHSKDQKDEITLVGNDLENVSQSAANIQQATTVKNKDIRKFLDGIYVSQKGQLKGADDE